MKTKLSFANKKWLLLLFVLLIGPFLFDVYPPGNFSVYGPVRVVIKKKERKGKFKKETFKLHTVGFEPRPVTKISKNK